MKTNTKKHILILGAGSVGKRHLKNFVDLGCLVSAMDPNEVRLKEASGVVSLQYSISDLQEIGQYWNEIDAVVICSPPVFHVDQAILALSAGKPVLLEKPVCTSLAEAQRLAVAVETYRGKLLLGYTYRWWQPLRDFRNRLEEVGKPLRAEFVMSAHLADWHPWERYQDFFMASKELGGGALLDESHFLDLMLWFFGVPESVYGCAEKLSSLEIETDDNVDLIAKYSNGMRVSIHLDLYGRPHRKFISVVGELGTLEWSFDPNRTRHSSAASGEWKDTTYTLERNDMFVSVAREFIEMLDGNAIQTCSVHDGLLVMKMIELIRESTRKKVEISISDSEGV